MSIAALTRADATPLLPIRSKWGTERRPETTRAESTELWGVDRLDTDLCGFSDLGEAETAILGIRPADLKISKRTVHNAYRNIEVRLVSDAATAVLWILGRAEVERIEDASAVGAVMSLAKRLGVAEKTVYEAAGISRRTYLHWKKHPATTPRAGSEGSLWSIVSAADDLQAHLGAEVVLARWLRERPGRLEALKEGHFRRFVDEFTGILNLDPASTAHRDVPVDLDADGPLEGVTTPADVRSVSIDGDASLKVVLE